MTKDGERSDPNGWTVLEHGPLEQIASNLWRIEGEIPKMAIRRVMTLVRMSDNRLVIHSGIAINDEIRSQIEALGEPAFLIVPNAYHRMDAAAFKARYPNLVVLCPAAAQKKVEKVVAVNGCYADFPADPLVELLPLRGLKNREGVIIVREPGREPGRERLFLVFNDTLFNMPHLHGFTGFILQHITQSTGGPRITRIARWFLIADKRAFAAHLRELAALPGLTAVIVSHHLPILEDSRGVLESVAATIE